MKSKQQNRKGSLYRRVILCFFGILAALLLVIGVIINGFCMSFIKKQRRTYNTLMMEKIEFEFKELYLQMNQFLDSLNETPYGGEAEETTFQKIQRELEFEEKLHNTIYRNGFQNFCEGIIFYNSEDQFYYVGNGPLAEGYSFSEDPCFQSLSAGMLDCTVIGPMEEDYRPDNVEKGPVIGFVKRRVGLVAEGSSLPPFVMASVKFEKIEETLDALLSANTGSFIMNEQGEILYADQLEKLGWDEDVLSEIQGQILENPDHIQTLSREGTLLSSIRLDNYGWILTVADSEAVLFHDINRLTHLVELLIAVCGAAGCLTAVFFARRILFPIEGLKDLVEEIGKDDKTYLEDAPDDEMGEVRALLNNMKKKIQELNARQYILEVRQREAEIRELQSQMNPHFLHNTLDNIYCIAQIEEIKPIVSLTRNLSEMLRYSVNSRSMYVSLHEELQHVRAYVEILNIRYEDGIRLELDVPPELENARVVKLMLQPVVENACIHGILPGPG